MSREVGIGDAVNIVQDMLAMTGNKRFAHLADRPWRGYELPDGSHTVADGCGSAFVGTDIARTLGEWLRWL